MNNPPSTFDKVITIAWIALAAFGLTALVEAAAPTAAHKLHLHWPLPETIPSPTTPPVGHIQCWEAEHPGSNSHLMCGDSWGSLVDVTEALEKKHQELCKAMPTTEEREKCEHF
jgi:hypothetical protein